MLVRWTFLCSHYTTRENGIMMIGSLCSTKRILDSNLSMQLLSGALPLESLKRSGTPELLALMMVRIKMTI